MKTGDIMGVNIEDCLFESEDYHICYDLNKLNKYCRKFKKPINLIDICESIETMKEELRGEEDDDD